CKWSIKPVKEGEGCGQKDAPKDACKKVPNLWNVGYVYQLKGKDQKRVSWKIMFKDKGAIDIAPTDRTSTAAWRAIFPRET
ncbi:MAG: hypothetical protein AAF658_15595, partial [Myxococcota bacterium]